MAPEKIFEKSDLDRQDYYMQYQLVKPVEVKKAKKSKQKPVTSGQKKSSTKSK